MISLNASSLRTILVLAAALSAPRDVLPAAANASAAPILAGQPQQPAPSPPANGRVRIAAAQPKARLLDWHLKPDELLPQVDKSLGELEALVDRAAAAGCDAIAFPEDTLGLGHWEAGNKARLHEVLPQAVIRMLDRFSRAAAAHRIYLVCCNDTIAADGSVRNSAFFLGRDGRQIGRYDKVNLAIHEQDRKRGQSFPVFQTPDLGGVGMLICYDMVFPEAARALTLGGADLIFHPTLGGAAIGDDDISRAAFRTRAVENFTYLVVAQRGSGSMIVSPQGKILAEAHGADALAIADIDPFGGREGGDAMNQQRDMRARLFRERSPEAFGILTAPNPPILAKVPETITAENAVAVSDKALTVGEIQFKAADLLVRQGNTNGAIAAFEKLCQEFPQTWIDRVSQERLAMLGHAREVPVGAEVTRLTSHPNGRDFPLNQSLVTSAPTGNNGLAAKYPGDTGIERDARVLFRENFETGSIEEIGKRWGEMSNKEGQVMALSDATPPGSSGRRSLEMTASLGKNTGGHLYTQLPRGVEKAFARFYVKFSADAGYIHHFVTLGGYHPATAWPQGGAGERPRGDDRFTVGIEPYGNYGRYSPPGAWNFYAYWPEMKGSADGKYWGNSLTPAEPALVPRDRWQCVELMLQCNSAPEKSDGELALWLDGKPVALFGPGSRGSPWTGLGFSLMKSGGEQFEGFRWRTSPDLKINFFWLLDYVTENAPRQNHVTNPNPVNRVWFDDIVVATEYIGPMEK